MLFFCTQRACWSRGLTSPLCESSLRQSHNTRRPPCWLSRVFVPDGNTKRLHKFHYVFLIKRAVQEQNCTNYLSRYVRYWHLSQREFVFPFSSSERWHKTSPVLFVIPPPQRWYYPFTHWYPIPMCQSSITNKNFLPVTFTWAALPQSCILLALAAEIRMTLLNKDVHPHCSK